MPTLSGHPLEARKRSVPAAAMLRSRAELRPREAPSSGADPQTSIVWVRALLADLLRRGIDGEALLRGTQVTPSQVKDSRLRIPLSRWRLVVQRALSLTRDDALGLAIGGSVPAGILQITGQLAFASETLRDALRTFERYQSILGDARLCHLVEQAERAYIVHAPAAAPEAALVRFDAELILSLLHRLSLHFVGCCEDIKEVWFTHAAPAYAARYGDLFRCPVRFDRPQNAIVIERSRLDRRQPYADRWFIETLQKSAERVLMTQRAPSLPDQVQALLRHQVDLHGVAAERVAGLFALNARQLRRQLICSNVRWSHLLDETRREIACDELQRLGVSLRELTERLGFSDQSAFNRAFKRWTGLTPAKYAHQARERAIASSAESVAGSRTEQR